MYSPNHQPSDLGNSSSNEVTGNVDSEHLLQNIIGHSEEESARSYSFFSTFDNLRSRFLNISAENQLEELTARRRMVTYLLIIFMVIMVIGLNFLPYVDSSSSSNDPIIFSTYYSSKYRICLPASLSEIYNKHYPVDTNLSSKTNETDFSKSSVDFNENGERCIDGDVDITLFYKDVNLDGYYRVYAGLSFELDYQGKWYQIWKNKHFFSSRNRYKRLFFGLSNLVSVENIKGLEVLDKEIMNENLLNIGTNLLGGSTERPIDEEDIVDENYTGKAKDKYKDNPEELEKLLEKMAKEGEKIEKELENLESGGHLYMSSFVPNFINTKNLSKDFEKHDNGNIKNIDDNNNTSSSNNNNDVGFKIKNSNNKVMNSIRLNNWNEFARQQDIKNYNLDIKLKTDPLRYYTTVNTYKRLSNNPKISRLPKKKLKSLRELDEFYLLNLRKFVQNEYQYISSFDSSIYNIFNITQVTLPNFNRDFNSNYKEDKVEGNEKDNNTSNTNNNNMSNNGISSTGLGKNNTNNNSNNIEQVTKTEPMHLIPKEILEKYFNPVNKYENSNNNDSSRLNNTFKNIDDNNNNMGINNKDNSRQNSNTSNSNNESDEDEFTGILDSNDSGIKLYFRGREKDMRRLRRMISLFSIIFVLKCLLETVLVYKQFGKVERSGIGRSVSLTALCMLSYQEVLEIFLLLYHGGIFFDNLIHFGALMVLKFFLLCIVHQNFIVLVWRATHSQHIRQGWVHTQKAFVLFYRYYFTFVFILVIIWYYFYSVSPIVISLAYLAWFPQIMLDIWRGQNNSMDFLFIFVSIVLKLSFPFYIFYVKDNVFNYDQFSVDSVQINRNLVYFLSFLSSVQLILISIQRLYGPRHFAKWSILPKIYSYVRPWSKMMQDDPQECVICMYNIVQSNRDWYLTPCDHLFHANCLREWTSIKLECPNCRRPLPPIT